MKDFTLGLLLLMLGIGVLLTAQDYPAIGDLRYGSGLFPSLIGTGLLAGGLCLAIGAARQLLRLASQHGNPDLLTLPWASALAPLVPCAVVVGYIVLSETLGATLCLMLSMLLLFCLRGVRPIPAVLTAVIAGLLIRYAFSHLLSVPLPTGPLGI